MGSLTIKSCCVPLLCECWSYEQNPDHQPTKGKRGVSTLPVCACSTSDHALTGWYLKGYWPNEFPHLSILFKLEGSKPKTKLCTMRTNIKYCLGKSKSKSIHKNRTTTNITKTNKKHMLNVQFKAISK